MFSILDNDLKQNELLEDKEKALKKKGIIPIVYAYKTLTRE